MTFGQFLKNNFKKPKFWVHISCFGFGVAGGLLLALVNEANILQWLLTMVVGGVIGLAIGATMAFIYKFEWSGFKDKNLWDWMQLLILPLLVAAGGLLLDRQIDQREEDRAKIRSDQETLKLYYDQMKTYTERINPLLLRLSQIKDIEKGKKFQDKELDDIEESLIKVKPDLETIKSLTLTVLDELDSEHKSQIIRYLYNIGVIRLEIPRKITNSNDKSCSRTSRQGQDNYLYESAIQLDGVDLSGIDFINKKIKFVNFCGVSLKRAKFINSDLSYANINQADLSEANLDGAIFSGIEFDNVEKIDKKYRLAMTLKNNSRILQKLQEKDARQTDNFSREEFEPLLDGQKLSDYGKDLSNVNLQEVDLSGVDLTGFNLEKSDLSGADLTKAKLHNATLKNVKLDRAKLHNIEGLESSNGVDKKIKLVVRILNNKVDLRRDLVGADLTNVNLDRQNLMGADLTRTNLEGASLKGVQLTKANLRGANLGNTDLTDAQLDEVKLVEVNLKNSNLGGANLNKASIIKTNLTGANLRKAVMYGVQAYSSTFDKANMMNVQMNVTDTPTNINGSSMREVNFTNSDLRGAYFTAVDLTSSILKGVKMGGVDLTESKLVLTDLRGAIGISKVTFENTGYFAMKTDLDFNPKKYPNLVELKLNFKN